MNLRSIRNSLYVLGHAAARCVDRCLYEIVRDFYEEPDQSDNPPTYAEQSLDSPHGADVPTTGWSSEAGDRRIKRVVAVCLGALVIVLLCAQTHHYYQRHPFFHSR